MDKGYCDWAVFLVFQSDQIDLEKLCCFLIWSENDEDNIANIYFQLQLWVYNLNNHLHHLPAMVKL